MQYYHFEIFDTCNVFNDIFIWSQCFEMRQQLALIVGSLEPSQVIRNHGSESMAVCKNRSTGSGADLKVKDKYIIYTLLHTATDISMSSLYH